MEKLKSRRTLAAYDACVLVFVNILVLALYRNVEALTVSEALLHAFISAVCVFAAREIGCIYRQIWRFGGIQCYIRLLVADAAAFLAVLVVEGCLSALVPGYPPIRFMYMVSIASLNLLGALAMRMFYRYAYKRGNEQNAGGKFFRVLMRIFAGNRIEFSGQDDTQKIKVAIIGAGNLGVALADELLNSTHSAYVPRCFVDVDRQKQGGEIRGLSVLSEDEDVFEELKKYGVQEVVFAIPSMDNSRREQLYRAYSEAGYKVKTYDYPVMQTAAKRQMRELDIEELLFRKPIVLTDTATKAYYRDKTILITGGGGSIGSELCRQLAKMAPRQIVILDIYENGAYEVQQELRLAYKNKLDIQIEICSITNEKALDRVFESYHPDIVINAAAHKHVPLMEHNCIEAVENNVFGTLKLIQACEKFGTSDFIMVSTDKAVNPTNVMGATKRMCELIVQNASTWGRVKYSATRFGNVLGSAGSVIPLFRRQIAVGGPVTITDKRIIRYFMTIPEASQLVLQSGAMARNGELFVLDMGKPVKILDLAENMIRLSGVGEIEIIETGLRPGEKLYEELLVKTEELDRTDSDLIFIERDKPISNDDLTSRLNLLQNAVETGDDDAVKAALKQVIPTYKDPAEVNKTAENTMRGLT
ncbi:MAG: polysaccharide biosynthesis protein [Oscillospiraceae bacterium]